MIFLKFRQKYISQKIKEKYFFKSQNKKNLNEIFFHYK
jgi:hypothetical protein